MGFLSDLTLVQRAGGAAVLVLLLTVLLLKQRKANGAPAAAKSAASPKATKSKKPGSTPKEKKGRSFGSSRKRKSDDVAEELVAEPRAGQGRMVPRLPAASEPAVAPVVDSVGFPEIADPVDAVPVAVAANGMINEPGWPTPGEVWAAPDASVGESAESESWQADAPQDDALAALETQSPTAPPADWASDDSSIEQVDGWNASSDDGIALAGQSDATWQAEAETFDWTAGDPMDGWATSDESTPVEDVVPDDAAWESPEDETPSWRAGEASEWTATEQVEETQTIATAVAEEFSVGDWSQPVEETMAAESPAIEGTPEIVWDPVDEAEEVEGVVADPAHVAEETLPVVELEPVVESEPVLEPEAVLEIESQPFDVSEPVAVDELVTETAHGIEEIAPAAEPEPVMETEPDVEADPVVEPEPVMETEPAVEAFVERPYVVVLPEMEAVDEDDDARYLATSDAEVEVAVLVAAATAEAVVADPAARWASMAPGGVVEERVTSTPVYSWARLRPGQPHATEANGANVHHQVAQGGGAAVRASAPVTAPSLAWWDVPSGVESDARRGRFALGGYALQAGHQAVNGVTFRDGVVPPPSHWVIGPVVGEVAPGTLVLHVDGLLNCRSEDLAVLTDPGFAPTTDGFSLRLAAAATGPFAASGTYIIT